VTLAQSGRVAWTVISIVVVETVTFGLAALPAIWFWNAGLDIVPDRWPLLRPAFVAMTLVPAYLAFAFALVALSALSTRVLGWRTPPPGEWKLRDLDWPLLDWSRYMIATHVVRVFVGTFFRASPLWTWYLRWNGARIGRGVFINSLSISDHNMLEFGDGVVIGEGVHLSGHTVEGGVVKTGHVRLGRFVTVGLGSMVGIGVEAGDQCQIGALSVVPKYSKLDAGAIYAGAPVKRLERHTRPAAVQGS
jgi:acetyltransferase-like isoleucine patch superfamily enzyme